MMLHLVYSLDGVTMLMITLVFCIETLIGSADGDDLMTVFTVIISFYFGTQAAKKERREE